MSTPVKLTDCKVGDFVLYRVSGSKADRRQGQGRIAGIDAENNRVSIHRRVGNSVTRLTVPPSRIIGFLRPGTPFSGGASE